MLGKIDLELLLERLAMPSKGRELVLKARRQAPVREVVSRGGNVVTNFESRKMAREVRTESRNYEFAAAVNFEFDDSVLEFYPQPCELRMEVVDPATGEIHQVRHIPDFLCISANSVTLIECKSEAKLSRLAEKSPWRYKRSTDGHFYAPLIEHELAELGIGYQILSEKNLPARRVENLLHLADYMHPAAEPCPDDVLTKIQALLKQHGHLYVSELIGSEYKISVDHINKAVADQLLVTSYDVEVLTEPSRYRIFRDDVLMHFVQAEDAVKRGGSHSQEFVVDIAPGATFIFDNQLLKIQLVGSDEIVCTDDSGGTRTLSVSWLLEAVNVGQIQMASAQRKEQWHQYTQAQLKIANQRNLQLQSEQPACSPRTISRLKAAQRIAEQNGASVLLALVPKTERRGNRTQRLTEEQMRALEAVFDEHWCTNVAKNAKACHRELTVLCSDRGIQVPSHATLIKYFDIWTTNQEIRQRHGKRMAYQLDVFVDVPNTDNPSHGSRAFQYVHIDHTQVDIELICSRTGKPLGRPWLTIAVDAYTREILAMYLTFDPPSYVSVMMLIRDLVRRHQRLPEFFVVDNGKDLVCSAFSTFLESMGVHLRMRPAGQPRHGAVLERMFGRMNSEYVHNLAGNTKATKNVRMTTGKHLPKNLAEWTLESCYAGLVYWAFEHYANELHPVLGMTPREARARSLANTGSRVHKKVLFNKDFLIATCPPAARGGLRAVDPQRGVKLNDLLYWNPIFSTPSLTRKSVAVREDPWDASSVYVRVMNTWVHAQCRNLLVLGQLTDMEREMLSQEYLSRNHGKKIVDGSEQRLSEFMRTFTPAGALAIEFERAQENKQLYTRLGGANISPIVTSMRPKLVHVSSAQTMDEIATNVALNPPRNVKKTLTGGGGRSSTFKDSSDDGLLDLNEF